MSRYNMPKNRKQFEDMLISAFDAGITCGYGIDHEKLNNDEDILRNRFRAYVQGKIGSMNECVDNKKTHLEQMIDFLEENKNE